MKLVREHINEKFVEKSDPVKDMKIGMNFPDNFEPTYILIREYPGSEWPKGTIFGFVGPDYLRPFDTRTQNININRRYDPDYFKPWIGEYFDKI